MALSLELSPEAAAEPVILGCECIDPRGILTQSTTNRAEGPEGVGELAVLDTHERKLHRISQVRLRGHVQVPSRSSTMWTARSIAGCLLAAHALATFTRTAAADGPIRHRAIRLAWWAPHECPSAGDVIADARGLVKDQEALEQGPPITVDAVVGRGAAGRWTLTLAVGGAKQRLEASTCADLARAGALFLALLMDPESGPSAPPPAPPQPAPSPPAPAAAAPSAAARASNPLTVPAAPEIA